MKKYKIEITNNGTTVYVKTLFHWNVLHEITRNMFPNVDYYHGAIIELCRDYHITTIPIECRILNATNF